MVKFKKYSLQQKRAYWKKQLDIEFEKLTKNQVQKPTSKHLYASGFLLTSKNGDGLSQNFKKQERANKLGQIAGLKANIKGK